jgi:hypothetical protein
MPSLESLSASIVAVGSFNPPIISVDWLRSHGLVGSDDAEATRTRPDYLVSRQITRFRTELASVQVFEAQLSIGSIGPVTPALCDLATGIFDLLPHTPVSALGLNFEAHYRTENLSTYHRLGDVLAPKSIWNEVFPQQAVGLQEMTVSVQNGPREEMVAKPDLRRVTIQPSMQVLQGIYLRMNDHHGLDIEGKTLSSASGASALTRKHWSSTWEQSLEVFDRVLSLALATESAQ